MLNAWADAWRTKNVKAYLSFYSDKFVPEGMTRKVWAAQRKQRIEGESGSIGLTIESVKVDVNGKFASVEFLQHYSSNKLNDHVTKVLSLTNEQNHWLIVKESVVKPSKPVMADDASSVETFKIRDVTSDERSEAMPEKMIQESANKALTPAPMAKSLVKPVDSIKTDTNSEVSKIESNKDKPLPAEDAPGYFERMLEKIGF